MKHILIIIAAILTGGLGTLRSEATNTRDGIRSIATESGDGMGAAPPSIGVAFNDAGSEPPSDRLQLLLQAGLEATTPGDGIRSVATVMRDNIRSEATNSGDGAGSAPPSIGCGGIAAAAGLSMKLTLPKGFDQAKDSCQMVILMHGIFSSKDYPPMPNIAKALAKQGIASIRFDFNGHGRSEGKMIDMTIAKELADAKAIWDYAAALPYVTGISLLGHSQGGVIASMTAGDDDVSPESLILLAPGAVIKEATQGGHFFGNSFDPANPPEYIKCFHHFKLGRNYLTQTQELDIYGVSQRYQGPVCIIHGSEDGIVPLWCSEKYHDIYSDSELNIVEGENHLIIKKRKEVIALILDFLSRKL